MNGLQRIKDDRDLILVAEIGALLHDLGKLSEEFIECKSIDNPNNERDLHTKILDDYPDLEKILRSHSFIDILHNKMFVADKNVLSLDRFVKKHHDNVKNSPVGYYKLLSQSTGGVDGLDSGIDKGALHNNGKQPKDDTYQATSFGHEANTIDVSKLKPSRDQLCAKLTDNLKAIEQAYEDCKNKKITKDGYISKLLESRTNIHKSVEYAFLKGLGDTRRSGNDVTLWDHSYSVASLYKSALSKIIYENEWTEPREINWKIIGVQYDKLGLIEKAHKLADIAGYRELTKDVDEEIKKIVEEDIPLGNEIYRDETGIYFVGPDIKEDKLRDLIRKKITDVTQEKTDGEIIPHITISKSSRSLVILTELLRDSKHNFLRRGITPQWTEDWDDASSRTVNDTDLKQRSFCKKQCRRDCIARGEAKEYQVDICPVCGVHPKCEHQDICKRCLERRTSRIEGWKKKKYQTIWIGEIADDNKKVAIVTGRFTLTGWLNGEFLNTVFSQTSEDYKDDWTGLRDKLKRCLSSNEKNSGLLEEIARGAYKKEPARDFYDKIVVDRNPLWKDDKIDWNNSADCQKAAEYLLLTIFRKHPSPARLRRIWATTEKFWKEIQKELETKEEIYSSYNHNIRFRRLEIRLKNNETLIRTLQNVKINETNILMYFDGEKLISTQNLSLSGLSGEINLEGYKDKIINIKREDENDSEFKKFEIKDISWGELYHPFLEVLLSPISFQFIVPANSVPNVLRTVKDKYSTEMGEVRGRLPLNMGVVFFDYKTALYAAINASRRMLQGFEDEPCDQFRVLSTNDPSIELVREGGRQKKIKIEDMVKDPHAYKYYQNFIVAEHVSVEKRNGYFKSFIDGAEVGLLNVSKLIENDKVMVYANHFDFEFLDTTARRLEIGYENWKRNDQSELRGPRPYYLEEFTTVFDAVWKLFDRSTISQTQIKKIQSQLAKLNLDWTGHESSKEFKTQIENILINIGTCKWWNSMDNGERELLMQVCLDKTIFDILEFYNSILKLKSGGAMNG